MCGKHSNKPPQERTFMNGEGANPRYCKAWQKATMQAKSKLPNSYNVIRHQISTGFFKQ